MAEQNNPHPVAARIVAHLEAAIGGDNVAENTVLALRHLAIGLRELESGASLADLDLIMDRLQLAAPIVSRDVERRLPAEGVHLGIAAAAGLLRQLALPLAQREPVPVSAARVQHIALIADELDAVVRRHRIEVAGDQFRRAIRIGAAQAAPFTGLMH